MAERIAVVGGGVIGMGIALELSGRGLDVSLLDRGIPGGESSGASGGMICPQTEGREPSAMLDLSMASRQLFPAWVARLEALARRSVGFLQRGAFQLAFDDASMEAIAAKVAWHRKLGWKAEVLDGSQLKARQPHLENGGRGGAYFADDCHLHAEYLCATMRQACTASGISFETGEVTEIVERGGKAQGVVFAGKTFSASAVVLAAGAWSPLIGRTGLPPNSVFPLRGQILELRGKAPTEALVFRGHQYVVPRADGTTLVGSTAEQVGFAKATTAEAIHRFLDTALSLSPLFREAEVGRSWSGLRPFTQDGAPILGPGALDGLWLATGHSRSGILLAPITALKLADWITGKPFDLDAKAFGPGRFQT